MTFNFEGYDIYYEEHGEGFPVVVLNGIFMSVVSWADFLPAFAKNTRLILLDLLDQGKSAKAREEYTQERQAWLVIALLDHLGIGKTDLIGISYGGEVALQLACTSPDRLRRLVLSNTCAYTSHWLRDIGRSWEYAFNSHDGKQFFKTCIPIVYSPQFYEKNYAWASAREEVFCKTFTAETYDAFARLTRSAESYDVRENLGEISVPTMVISSEFDYVTPLYQQQELVASIPGAVHAVIPGGGHAVMYEKPEAFTALVLGFLKFDEPIVVM